MFQHEKPTADISSLSVRGGQHSENKWITLALAANANILLAARANAANTRITYIKDQLGARGGGEEERKKTGEGVREIRTGAVPKDAIFQNKPWQRAGVGGSKFCRPLVLQNINS